MRTNFKKIKGLLGKYNGFQVSHELDKKVLKAIDNLNVQNDFTHSVNTVESPSVFQNLNISLFQRLKRYAVIAVVLLIAITGTIYFNQNSYAYHLNKAGFALTKLETLLNGNQNQASLIPNALADETTSSVTATSTQDEDQILVLVLDVDHETQLAIESAEQLSDVNKLRNALDAIYVFQIKEVDVLSDAVEAVLSQENTVKITQVLVSSSIQQKLVSQAIKFVKDSEKNGEKQANIDIETDDDKGISSSENEAEKTVFKLAEVKDQYNDAKLTFEEVKKIGAEDKDIENLEKKLDKAETAIEEGKLGRAHGLSTATEVKAKNIIRKAEKLTEKDSDTDEEDNNKTPKVPKIINSGNIESDDSENIDKPKNREGNVKLPKISNQEDVDQDSDERANPGKDRYDD